MQRYHEAAAPAAFSCTQQGCRSQMLPAPEQPLTVADG